MFDEKVLYPEKFVLHNEKRKSTDVCCTVIGAVFALVMFIVACTMWNKGTLSPNPDRFDNTFFGFNTNGKGDVCKNGYVYSHNATDFSVFIHHHLG